jgi:hypothetical protein
MAHKIQIRVHFGGQKEVRSFELAEQETVGSLIQRLSKEGHLGESKPEEWVIFVEESGEELPHHHRLETAKHHHIHLRHSKNVEITINGDKYHTHRGSNTVLHLRELGKVPADEILSEFKGGKYVDLADNGHVEICGGEIFASHVKSGGSS